MRTDIAVKPLVVHPYQFVPYLYRLTVEPLVETVSYLLYLGGRFLYGFLVRHSYRFAVPLYLFGYFGNGVLQCVYKQVLSVVILYGIGVIDYRGISLQAYQIGVVHVKIHHIGFRSEKLCGKIGVQLRVNPTLAHVDVEFLVGYRFGYGFLQCLYSGFRPVLFLACEIGKIRACFLAFGDDVSGYELAFVFPFSGGRVIEYLAFEVVDNLVLVLACGLHQIVHIHTAVKVKAACQRFARCQLHGRVYLLERYRLTHDVGFEYVALDLHFNREHFHAEAVKHDKLLVVIRVEKAPFGDKSIIASVQPFTQMRLFRLFLLLFDCKFKICLADREIVVSPLRVHLALVHRDKIGGRLLI